MKATQPSIRRRRTWRLIAVLAALALVAAACGGDDDDDDADAIATTTIPAPTGPPIYIMTVQSYDSGANAMLAGLRAAILAQNQPGKGGINGRPLELLWCDALLDANKQRDNNLESKCIRDNLAKNPVVLTGHLIVNAGARDLIEPTGIPEVGGLGTTYQTTNPRSLMFAAPAGTNPFAPLLSFKELGFKTSVNVIPSTAPPVKRSATLQALFDQIPVKELPDIRVDTAVADWQVVAQQLKQTNADVVSLASCNDNTVALLNALQALGGYKPAFSGCAGFSTDVMKAEKAMLDNNCYMYGQSLPIASTQKPMKDFHAALDLANQQGQPVTD